MNSSCLLESTLCAQLIARVKPKKLSLRVRLRAHVRLMTRLGKTTDTGWGMNQFVIGYIQRNLHLNRGLF